MLTNEKKAAMIEQATESKKYFEIRIVIKLLGVTLLDYTWPPQKS